MHMLYCSHQKVKCFSTADISVQTAQIVHTWRILQRERQAHPMNIALLGFGTVGKAFYEHTHGRSDLRVTSVLSRRPRPELPCTVTYDFDEIVRDRSVGIVVEVMGGLEPAYDGMTA